MACTREKVGGAGVSGSGKTKSGFVEARSPVVFEARHAYFGMMNPI
jgi:hypothetical protein